jgi:hypothetical protein
MGTLQTTNIIIIYLQTRNISNENQTEKRNEKECFQRKRNIQVC